METMKVFSQNIKKAMNGVTMEALSDKCGYCIPTVRDALNGRRNTRLNTALCVANALGCSLDALLEHVGMRYYSEKVTPGQKLKELKKKRKLTDKKLSEMSGVARTTINNFENDLADMELQSILKLAKVLDFSLDWLCWR